MSDGEVEVIGWDIVQEIQSLSEIITSLPDTEAIFDNPQDILLRIGLTEVKRRSEYRLPVDEEDHPLLYRVFDFFPYTTNNRIDRGY